MILANRIYFPSLTLSVAITVYMGFPLGVSILSHVLNRDAIFVFNDSPEFFPLASASASLKTKKSQKLLLAFSTTLSA